MCFVPACFEILGMIFFAPIFLNITHIEAANMGAVIGAVSPAVIVPKMLKLSDEGYGKENGIPQLIMTGASVDDIFVFVIVMFSAFVCLEQTGNVSVMSFAKIPVSIILGIIAGGLIGVTLSKLFKQAHIRDTVKIILILSMSLLLSAFEDSYGNTIPFSAMIAVMCIGISIQKERPDAAKRLSERYSKLWVFFEILLFTLVGACINANYVIKAGFQSVLLIFVVLVFRMAGVFVCLIKTKLSIKERLFCMLAYMPKATVQAAIGGIPLAMGLKCGEIVLTVAVLSIIITAPLGAFIIDITYKKLLKQK